MGVSGILIGHTISLFEDHSSFTASNDNEYVRLHVGLKGDYRFRYQQLGKSFDLAGGHHNIMYSKGIDLEVYNKTLEIEVFGINFPKDSFLKFADGAGGELEWFIEKILAGKHAILSPVWGRITSRIQEVIDEILWNPYSGHMQHLFLLAKSLELFVLCVENYQEVNRQKLQFVKTNADKEKIIAARDFLNAHLEAPPTISEVAKAVGLNEFKLKRGFKEVFHNTMFGYLTTRRLQLARKYLLQTQKSAAEISYELGYSSPQHFHKQFKQKFGRTPNSMRKNP